MEQRLRLGQLLVDASIISEEQLQDVLALQKEDGRKLGTLLVERGLINETQLTQILSQQLSVPWVSLYHVDFSRKLLSLVPRDVAEKYCLVPIYVRHVRGQGDTLYVAMDDPTNEEALKHCSIWSGLPTRAMIASPSDVRNAIRVYYPETRRLSIPPTAEETTAPAATLPSLEPHPESPAPPPEPPAGEAAAAPIPAKLEELPPAPESPPEAPPAETTVDQPQPIASPAPREEPTDSLPPPEEVASAWRPPPAAAAPEFEEEPPAPDQETAQTPAAAQPTVASPDVFVPDFEGPPRVESAPAAEPPAAAPEAAPAAEPPAAAPEAAPTAEASPTAEAQGQPPAAPESSGPPSDEVTLELGREIPLEELLPEVRRMRRAPKSGAERLMAMTLLDGTTLALPLRRMGGAARKKTPSGEREAVQPAEPQPTSPPPAEPPAEKPPSVPPPAATSGKETDLSASLTAAEVVAALRAAASGEDVSEILGDKCNWQILFASLLTLLIRKRIISGEEFVEELKRR